MIAFLGLGRMGKAMAGRLLDTGRQVTVWNRTAARTEPLAAAGAHPAATPAEAVRHADIVITMLSDQAAVESVVSAATPALRPGACLVEMSTIGPDAVKHLATLLPPGVDLIDAPVLGSVPAAVDGVLTVLAGGPVERAEPVLAGFGRVVACGESGRGAALKLVLMTTVIGGVALVTEALALAQAFGVPEEQALDALRSGPSAGLVARATATGDHYPISLAAKDLGLVTAAVDAPVTAAVRDLLRHAAANGAAFEDLSRLGV